MHVQILLFLLSQLLWRLIWHANMQTWGRCGVVLFFSSDHSSPRLVVCQPGIFLFERSDNIASRHWFGSHSKANWWASYAEPSDSSGFAGCFRIFISPGCIRMDTGEVSPVCWQSCCPGEYSAYNIGWPDHHALKIAPGQYGRCIISGCRIAAIAADCKSAASGLRWCKSNHPDHDSVVKWLRQESAKLWSWVRFPPESFLCPVSSVVEHRTINAGAHGSSPWRGTKIVR